MDAVLAALEGTAVAQALRISRWGYAAVNATHILGIALLVGATVPLNLRLLGLWRGVPVPTLGRVLGPVAAAGLTLAVLAGLLLFSIRAREYAGLGVFQLKISLVVLGALSALAAVRAHGFSMEQASGGRLKALALVSMVCWIGALVCGRLIAFVGE